MNRTLLATFIAMGIAPQVVHADSVYIYGKGTQSYANDSIVTPAVEVRSTEDAASLSLSNSTVGNEDSGFTYGIQVWGNTDATLSADSDTVTGETFVQGNGAVSVDIENSTLSETGSQVEGLNIYNASTVAGTDISIGNHTIINGNLVVNTNAETEISVDESSINGQIFVGNNGDNTLNTTISNSTITARDGLEVGVEINGDGDVSTAIINSSITQDTDSIAADSAYIYSTGGNADLQVSGSHLQYGIVDVSDAGNASVSITNSTVGTDADSEATYNNPYMVTVKGNTSSVLDIENSAVKGDILTQSLMGGDSSITLGQGTEVTGDIYENGATDTINIDNATLNGNIYTGVYQGSSTGTVNSQINLSNTTYRGNIISEDSSPNSEDDLTININQGADIGGLTADTAQKISGYDNVNVNINYLSSDKINHVTTAPTDITTFANTTYFTVNNSENILVDDGISNQGTLAPIRSGSYVLDDVTYDAQKTASDGNNNSTYAVAFYTVGGDTPDDGGNTPPPSDVVSDIQATQAGLVASDDMIHRIANDITGHLDTRQPGSNIWVSGIYDSSDRTAAQTDYQNNINGAQFGGYLNFDLRNGDTVTTGIANGYLHNALDLNNKDGHNSIDGTYYSLYGRWEQAPSTRNMRWFADSILAYGDMSYSASGTDAGLHSGGDYDGTTWLLQNRAGFTAKAGRFELQPYATLGYVNVQTDGFNDGYSQIGEGKQTNYFAGAGVRVATELAVKHVKSIKPYLTAGYNAQFGGKTHLDTADYSFSGENLNGGNAGAGVTVQFNKHWSANAQVDTEFGHAINNAVEGNLTFSYSL